jgi:hypothetical protein
MSKLPNDCICLFFSSSRLGRRKGWLEGDPTWLIHYTKKHQKTQTGQFHFFSGYHPWKTYQYFKNLTVKVSKIWCNDVYMSILQFDIFWWKLIDRNCFNQIFNTKVVLMTSDYPFGIFRAVLFCLYVTSYLVEVRFNKSIVVE